MLTVNAGRRVFEKLPAEHGVLQDLIVAFRSDPEGRGDSGKISGPRSQRSL